MDELRPYHVIFDGVLPHPPTKQRINTVLDVLVRATGLTRVPGLPQVARVDEGHWQGMVVIAESHITLTGFGRIACVDVFSCKPVDIAAAGKVLRDWLGGHWIEPRDARPMDDERRQLYQMAEAA